MPLQRDPGVPEIIEDVLTPPGGAPVSDLPTIPPGEALRRGAGRLTGIQSEEGYQRALRLAAAAQQFMDPTLSGYQTQYIKNIGARAGMQGLFGGLVQNAQDRTFSQFRAGNRLAGLRAIANNFLTWAPRGVTMEDQAFGPGGPGTLAQITALRQQFQYGGQAGRNMVNDLDPASLGAFMSLPDRGVLSQPAGRGRAIGMPGNVSNDLARRFAEGAGAVDTGGFIQGNQQQMRRDVRRAGLIGLNAPASSFMGGQAAQNTVFGQIMANAQDPRWGIRGQLMGDLAGLEAAGLLNFGAGATTMPAFMANNQDRVQRAAVELFSPQLFG